MAGAADGSDHAKVLAPGAQQGQMSYEGFELGSIKQPATPAQKGGGAGGGSKGKQGAGDQTMPVMDFPELDRGKSEAMLREADVDGGFLLRRKDVDKFIVSVLHRGKCRHHMVSFVNGQWQHKKTAFAHSDPVQIAKMLLLDEHVVGATPISTGAPSSSTSARTGAKAGEAMQGTPLNSKAGEARSREDGGSGPQKDSYLDVDLANNEYVQPVVCGAGSSALVAPTLAPLSQRVALLAVDAGAGRTGPSPCCHAHASLPRLPAACKHPAIMLSSAYSQPSLRSCAAGDA